MRTGLIALATIALASTAAAQDPAQNPCANGDCKITIEVPDEVANEFGRRQTNYKVYAGCARNLGARLGSNSDPYTNAKEFRSLTAAASSAAPVLSVPANFEGRYGTVVIYFGAVPQRWAIVDFGDKKDAKVNYGYQWTGSDFQFDKGIVNSNVSFERKVCR